MRVDDRVALVTGGAQGIGRTISLKLAAAGADVAVIDVNLDLAEETAEEVRKTGRRAIAISANVTNMDEADSAVKKTVEELGALHILVNNAGITRDALLMRMKEEDWDLVLDVNLKGAFNFHKGGGKGDGQAALADSIVNIASIVGPDGQRRTGQLFGEQGRSYWAYQDRWRASFASSATCTSVTP